MIKKLILLITTFLLVISCSIDRPDKLLVIEGVDGANTLVNVITLNQNDEGCANGGTLLEFGLDLDNDGMLSSEEVTQSAYVCNGVKGDKGDDGTSVLVEVTVIQPNEEYPYGGVLITTGYDLNGNETLEETEIASRTVVENGADGTNGNNGLNTLVKTTSITDIQVCSQGGFIIESGLDTNEDGILQDSEVNSSNTQTLCNGEDGKSLAVSVEYLDEENQYCGNGGYVINIGVDQNGNGELEADEQTVSFPVCNGYDGQDGFDGTNGLSIVANTTEVEGGTLVELYIDSDSSGDYSDGDVSVNSFTVNDGEQGLQGIPGEQGLQGPKGDVGPQGPQGEMGPAGPKGADGQDGQDGVNAYQILSSSITENGLTTVTFYQDINDNGIVDEGDLIINQFVVTDGKDGLNGIDGIDGQDGASVYVSITETEGGYFLYFYQNEVLITSIFIRDGVDGLDGLNGIDGIDGVDGQDGLNGTNGIDGVSTTITTEVTTNGYYLIFWENNVEITRILIEDGQDGTNGVDGLTPVITYEVIPVGTVIDNYTYTYGGVKVIITVGTDVTTFIVENGPQGPAGANGQDGEDGVCDDCCGDNTVTICHKVTHTNKESEIWAGLDYVTLELNLSEYVHHVYEFHNGNSTQNDSWGTCDDSYQPIRLAVKDPFGNYNIGTGNDENCHYNYSNVTAYSQEEYDWFTKGGGIGEFYVPFPTKTFEVPDGMDADDFDCDSTPNL